MKLKYYESAVIYMYMFYNMMSEIHYYIIIRYVRVVVKSFL